LARGTVKVPPLHIVAVCAGIKGLGFTVTVTVNTPPLQEPDNEGVTVYTTLIGAFVVLVSAPPIVDWFVPEAEPVIPTTEGAGQL
jgi:hypothetical protein